MGEEVSCHHCQHFKRCGLARICMMKVDLQLSTKFVSNQSVKEGIQSDAPLSHSFVMIELGKMWSLRIVFMYAICINSFLFCQLICIFIFLCYGVHWRINDLDQPLLFCLNSISEVARFSRCFVEIWSRRTNV